MNPRFLTPHTSFRTPILTQARSRREVATFPPTPVCVQLRVVAPAMRHGLGLRVSLHRDWMGGTMRRLMKLFVPVAGTIVSVALLASPALANMQVKIREPCGLHIHRVEHLSVRPLGAPPRLVQERRLLRQHRLPVQDDRHARRRRALRSLLQREGHHAHAAERRLSPPSSSTTTTVHGRSRSAAR